MVNSYWQVAGPVLRRQEVSEICQISQCGSALFARLSQREVCNSEEKETNFQIIRQVSTLQIRYFL